MNFKVKYKMISKAGRTIETQNKTLKEKAELFSIPRRKSYNHFAKRPRDRLLILDLLRSALSEEPARPVIEKPDVTKASPKRQEDHYSNRPFNFLSPSYTLQDKHIPSIKFKSPTTVKKKSPERIKKAHCLSPTKAPAIKPQLIAFNKAPRQIHS